MGPRHMTCRRQLSRLHGDAVGPVGAARPMDDVAASAADFVGNGIGWCSVAASRIVVILAGVAQPPLTFGCGQWPTEQPWGEGKGS
jgi:hypothetical protein